MDFSSGAAVGIATKMGTIEFTVNPTSRGSFEEAQVLAGKSGTVSGANTDGSLFWHNWTAPTNGVFSVDTLGSNFDTTLVVYAGGKANDLTTVVTNHYGRGMSHASFAAVAGTTYKVVIGGYKKAIGHYRLNWRFDPGRNSRPRIATQPTSQLVGMGRHAMLRAKVDGLPPMTYQWEYNGRPLMDGGNVNGVTTDTLTFIDVQHKNIGAYSLKVSNSLGTTNTIPAYLIVTEKEHEH